MELIKDDNDDDDDDDEKKKNVDLHVDVSDPAIHDRLVETSLAVQGATKCVPDNDDRDDHGNNCDDEQVDDL